MRTIHFHHSDTRFCGTTERPREFCLDPNEVTCEECKRRDTFTLSASGRAYLKSIGAAEVR